MARSLDELWAAYCATLPRLEAARAEHDEAYTESQRAYRAWIAAGGTHKTEPDLVEQLDDPALTSTERGGKK